MRTKDKTLKKDLLWNTLGSLTYAAVSVVLAFLVMRMAGAEDGGIFGFGYSTFGQQMFIIAYFGIRPFHITDVAGEYRFCEYRKARIVTTLCSVAAALLYPGLLSATGRYTLRKAFILLLLSLMKIADGYADVYECECQRSGELWRGGRELCIRSLLVIGTFSAVLAISGDLLPAAAAAVAVQFLVILIFRKNLEKAGIAETGKRPETCGTGDAEHGTAAGRAGRKPVPGTWKALLRSTALLFVSVFLDFYVFSGAKYAIDLKLDDTASGIFNILFMPTSAIYMLANFVIKPFMTRMAASLSEGDQAGFRKTRQGIAGIILGMTALICVLTAFLGRWVLGIFERLLGDAYTGQLSGYNGEFFLIILGGGLYALANLYYYVLVIRRRQKAIFFVYSAAALITAAAAPLLVETFQITGAAVIYAAMMSVLVCGMKICDILKS